MLEKKMPKVVADDLFVKDKVCRPTGVTFCRLSVAQRQEQVHMQHLQHLCSSVSSVN